MSSSFAPSPEPSDALAPEISAQTRELAKRLLAHMGLKAALAISTENQWHGIVSALEEMKQQR